MTSLPSGRTSVLLMSTLPTAKNLTESLQSKGKTSQPDAQGAETGLYHCGSLCLDTHLPSTCPPLSPSSVSPYSCPLRFSFLKRAFGMCCLARQAIRPPKLYELRASYGALYDLWFGKYFSRPNWSFFILFTFFSVSRTSVSRPSVHPANIYQIILCVCVQGLCGGGCS